MYFADLFNSNNLLQHFGGYLKQHNNINSDEFLFHATILTMSMYKIHALNALCLEQMETSKGQMEVRDEKIFLWSPTLVELLTLIPPSLMSLVVMQNKVFPLLQSVLGSKQSFPSSMRDIVNNIHKYNLPEPVKKKTLIYWQNGGLAAREYRDIAEHHYYLLAQSYYQFKPIERVLIYLPDNPSQKKHEHYTFDKKIDCIAYLEKSFIELCQYIDAVLSDLGFAKEPISQPLNPMQLVLEEGVRKTLGAVFYDTAGQVGMEVGQTEERKMFFKTFDYRERTAGTS